MYVLIYHFDRLEAWLEILLGQHLQTHWAYLRPRSGRVASLASQHLDSPWVSTLQNWRRHWLHHVLKKSWHKPLMWLKQCHKLPIWEWFIPPIDGDDWGMVKIIILHTLWLENIARISKKSMELARARSCEFSSMTSRCPRLRLGAALLDCGLLTIRQGVGKWT